MSEPKTSRTRKPFRTNWYNRKPAFWFNKYRTRDEGVNGAPLPFILEPKDGVTPSSKPPVRIFVGTEPRQARAERVFVWSIERVRDPARRYEIHLMKDIAGIPRTRWATGFTNYRYAIPHWAGGAGRAIYNDVDQVYLADPAEIFDMDLQGRGIASVEERESSVTVIDCERMLPFWTLAAVKDGKGHKYFQDLVHDNDLWTRLPGEWNSRDGEYPLEQSKLLHFTTLYTQPWKPFPEEYRYREGPGAARWKALEHEADSAGFQISAKQGQGIEVH